MKYIKVRNPYNREVITELKETLLETIDEIFNRARESFKKISSLTNYERYQILMEVASMIENDSERFAKDIVYESGKTINEARGEVKRTIQTLKLSADVAKNLSGRVVPITGAPEIKNKLAYYKIVPAGIVVAITPFNFPLNLVAHKIGPAVAAGCSIVFKPSTQTPVSGLNLVKVLYKAGLPDDAVQTVIGSGATIGKAVISHTTPRVITFTGSKEIGEFISKNAGLKRIALELGSNSAVYVSKDSDLKSFIFKIVRGAYALAGQVCISIQRVYVDREIFDEFIDFVKEEIVNIKIGNPIKENTNMGPMINEAAIEKALYLIDDSIKRGGELITGGKREENFILPTLLVNVPEDAEVVKREAFSPLMVVNPVESMEDAIRRINDSEYGLQASIYTSDLKRAMEFTNRVEAGGVLVNEIPTFRVDIMPYGGIKGSGIGREGPEYAVEEMTEKKLIIMDYN